jgi:hypothetical protein
MYATSVKINPTSLLKINLVKDKSGEISDYNALLIRCKLHKVPDIHGTDELVWTEVYTAKSLISEADFDEIEVGIKNCDLHHRSFKEHQDIEVTDVKFLFGMKKKCYIWRNTLLLFIFIKLGTKMTVFISDESLFH